MEERPEKKKKLNDNVNHHEEPGYNLLPNGIGPFNEKENGEEEDENLDTDTDVDTDTDTDTDIVTDDDDMDEDLDEDEYQFDIPQLNWGLPNDGMGDKSTSLDALPTTGSKDDKIEPKQRRKSV